MKNPEKKGPKPYTKVPKKSSHSDVKSDFEKFYSEFKDESERVEKRLQSNYKDIVGLESVIPLCASKKHVDIHVEALNIRYSELLEINKTTLTNLDACFEEVKRLRTQLNDLEFSMAKKINAQDKTITEVNLTNTRLKTELCILQEQFLMHVNRGFFARLFNK